MDAQTSDLVVGMALMAVFMPFVFVLGRLIVRFQQARYAAAWGPIASVIDGTVVRDTGGGATSYLSGTYRGRRVRATMMPDRNRYSGDNGNDRYNDFEVMLLDVVGGSNWRLEHHTPVFGFGKSGWQLDADDPAVAERLRRANPAARLYGAPTIVYDRRGRSLALRDEVTPHIVPTPEAFTGQLELLLALAALNAEVNAPEGARCAPP
jgi:hypothetical protein